MKIVFFVPRRPGLPVAGLLLTLVSVLGASLALADQGASQSADPDTAWRAANARVHQAGGWRAYAREAVANQPTPCTAASGTGAVLTEAEALRRALAPQPWPPLAWTQAEGSARRVHLDGEQVAAARQARQRWLSAVAAEADLRLGERYHHALDAAADLAGRLAAVGNLPAVEAERERIALAEAEIACREAQLTRDAARAALAVDLRLDADAAANLRLPEALPPLPEAPLSEARQAELRARGNAPTLAAPAQLAQQLASRRYAQRWAMARHYQREILPRVETLREEAVRRYNGMLIGPDELLREARAALAHERAALAALAAFWQADNALQAALMGNPGHPDSGE